MPLINGQKMACEPCIRGHRSTKCNHANDRLMVPVRKPGRPLSSCPHPASRPCSCALVTAAIPKKQTCRCGPSSSSQSSCSDKVKDEPESVTPSLPTSPRKCSSSTAFKVQKQTPKSTTRKQSIDVSTLDRMNSNHINILPAPKPDGPDGIKSHVPANGLNQYPAMAMSVDTLPFGPSTAVYSMLQQSVAPPFVAEINGKPNGNSKSLNGATKPAAQGCCGGKNRSQSTPATKLESLKDDKSKVSASCCSYKTNGINTDTQPITEKVDVHVDENAMPMFQAPPMAMANGMYPFFATPNIFTYPPQYASYMQPLQPKQWRQVISNMNMPPPVQQAYMYGSQSALLYQNGVANPANPATWASHQCTCGDSCQCIGCAAHPYNEATQDYVRSAWNVMMQDNQNGHAPGSGNSSSANGTRHQVINGKTSQANDTAIAVQEEGTVSPTALQTPSDATSVAAEEQALSVNDFFFVSYPFTEGCEGDMSSCPCGDDCQCIGCALHNNPGSDPLDSLLATTCL